MVVLNSYIRVYIYAGLNSTASLRFSNIFHNDFLEDTTYIGFFFCVFHVFLYIVCICIIGVGLVGVINCKKVKSVDKIGCFF